MAFYSIPYNCLFREATSESEGIIAAVALLPENVPVQDTPTSQLVERTAGPSSEVYRNTDPLDRVCKTCVCTLQGKVPNSRRALAMLFWQDVELSERSPELQLSSAERFFKVLRRRLKTCAQHLSTPMPPQVMYLGVAVARSVAS